MAPQYIEENLCECGKVVEGDYNSGLIPVTRIAYPIEK
jgi:hypothetical protein